MRGERCLPRVPALPSGTSAPLLLCVSAVDSCLIPTKKRPSALCPRLLIGALSKLPPTSSPSDSPAG